MNNEEKIDILKNEKNHWEIERRNIANRLEAVDNQIEVLVKERSELLDRLERPVFMLETTEDLIVRFKREAV